MGRVYANLTATARLSNDNDEQDDEDRQRWERFIADVKQLAEREQYADIDILVSET